MSVLRVAPLMLRPRVGRRGEAALPVVAFGVVTTLLLTVCGGALVFFSWRDPDAGIYQMLSVFALVLLSVPLITVGASAARLSARRRDDQLSSLRLLGATVGTVTAIAVIESTVTAAVGALAGVAGYGVITPLVGLIPFRGEPLGGTLWMHPAVAAAIVSAVVILACISSVVGLRKVSITPLGVRTRQQAPRISVTAAVIGTVVIGVAVAVTTMAPNAGSIALIVGALAAAFAAVLAVLNLLGPVLIGLVGRIRLRRARTANQLIAARTILESPQAVWRQVNGVALASFVAVFAGVGLALVDSVGDAATLNPADVFLVADIRTGVLIMIAITFIMVGCSVGITQTANILDRRDFYISLDRVGMPVATMDRARTTAVLAPMIAVVSVSAGSAALLLLPVTGMALLFAPLSVLTVVVALAAGVALVWGSVRVTTPVLRSVLRGA